MDEYYSNSYAEENEPDSPQHLTSEDVLDTSQILEECLVKTF